MANNENLRPIKKGELSKAEAKRRGSLGGKKSVESRRARKTLKEALLGLLSEGEIQDKMVYGLVVKAMKGDAAAAKLVAELIGEYKQSIDVGVADIGLIVEFDEGED